jgi:hypothetical protein
MLTANDNAARRLPTIARLIGTTFLAGAAIGCANADDLATAPSRSTSVQTGGNAALVNPFPPVFACPDSMFKADFTADAVNATPGNPVIGSWTVNQAEGVVRVRNSLGGLADKPVELLQRQSSLGGVNLLGQIGCYIPPSTGRVVAYWRSLVHSSSVSFGAIVLRDDQGRVIGAVEYRPNNVLTYNGVPIPGVGWASDVPLLFRVVVDLDGKTTTLSVNNVARLAYVPFVQGATNVWQIGFELGGMSAQSFAWDDIVLLTSP